jgi:hypothetical protein
VLGLVPVLAIAVLAAGCGVIATSGPHAIPQSQVPFHLLTRKAPTTTTTTAPLNIVPVTVWLVSPTQQYLVPVQRSLRTTATLRTVLNALLDGPSTPEREKGVRTAISGTVHLLGWKATTSLATLDFNQAFGQISGTEQVLAVAQVVFTASGELGENCGIQFKIDGVPTEVPTATGAQVAGPVHLLQYLTLTTPIVAAATPTTTTASTAPTATCAPS